MTPKELAQLHYLCFETPRPWTAPEFRELLESNNAFLVSQLNGFALGRIAGPEVELLTLAVHPDARRTGIGRKLVTEFETRAKEAHAAEAFLEVSDSNVAAISLYEQIGYFKAGYRKDYYGGPKGPRSGAFVMRRIFGLC